MNPHGDSRVLPISRTSRGSGKGCAAFRPPRSVCRRSVGNFRAHMRASTGVVYRASFTRERNAAQGHESSTVRLGAKISAASAPRALVTSRGTTASRSPRAIEPSEMPSLCALLLRLLGDAPDRGCASWKIRIPPDSAEAEGPPSKNGDPAGDRDDTADGALAARRTRKLGRRTIMR